MLARYYGQGSMLRFLSVDSSSKSIDSFDPQSWNRYSYVGNNPIKYLDPNGKFKIKGEYSHQNLTRAALPASGGIVNRNDVVSGNISAEFHGGGPGRPNHLNTNGNASAGSSEDTRVKHGTAKLGEALDKVASGDLGGAGKALGDSLHSFQDTVGHGNVTRDQHYSDANGGNVDSSGSPGIETRAEGATALSSKISEIFEAAAAAIQAGADPSTVKAEAGAKAQQAAQDAYQATKTKLEQSGKKPKGY